MMALTDDEKATLEALNKKANEPDDADDDHDFNQRESAVQFY